VGTWRIRNLFCVLYVHPPRTNRGSDVPIRSPKAETQKQQTHLNHVAAAVLISMSAERRVTQTTAPGRENCHTLRDCVVTQSPQAACSRSTDVLCWRLQQRPMAAVHVCCKHTHAQVGNFDHSGSLLCTAVAHKSSKLPKHFDVADQKTPLSSSFSSPFPICSLSRLHCGR
jgi:hypothetical protein